jgi:hypothetical protein
MKPHDVFEIFVRIAGLAIFLFGGWYIVFALSVLVGVEKRSNADEMSAYLFDGVIYVLVSLYFLRGAPLLMRFCFPRPRDEAP